MRQEIPFCGPTQEGRLKLTNPQRSINLYPKIEPPGAKNKVSLYSTPGLKFLLSIGSGVCRSNGVKWNNNLYFVVGNELISIDSTGSGSTIGTLSTSSGRVVITKGRTYIALVDGTSGYTYDGTTFATISDGDFPSGATHISYLDGRFIANEGSSDQFYISSTDDPTAWAALDFASAEANPDDILALVASYKNIYMVGSETAQVFYNSGNPDFPFAPYPNGVLEVGIEAKYTLIQDESGVYWLATDENGDLYVVRVRGLQYERISTSEIDWQLQEFSDVSDAIAWIENEGGRNYFVLTLPSADKTYCYDLSLPKEVGWFEKKSDGVGRWRANGYGKIGNKRIVGDYNSSNFYELDFDTYDENGNTLERKRIAQVIHEDKKSISFHSLILDIQSGVGITSGQGSDPQIMLRYSDDGGRTWSSELWENLGKLGKYNEEVEWRKLGDSRERIFEVKVTDPVEVNILGAYANLEVLDH